MKFIGLLFIYSIICFAQDTTKSQDLLSEYEFKIKNKRGLFFILIENHSKKMQFDSAEIFLDSLSHLPNFNQDVKIETAELNLAKGIILHFKGRYGESNKYLEKALAHADSYRALNKREKILRDVIKPSIFSYLVDNMNRLENNPSYTWKEQSNMAFSWLNNKGKTVSEEMRNLPRIIGLSNLANDLLSKGKCKDAKIAIDRVNMLEGKLSNNGEKAVQLVRLAKYNTYCGDVDTAQVQLNKALELMNGLGKNIYSHHILGTIYFLFGKIEMKRDSLNFAFSNFQAAAHYWKQAKSDRNVLLAYQEIGKYFEKKGKLDEASYYYEFILQNVHEVAFSIEVRVNLSKVYELKEDYKNAYKNILSAYTLARINNELDTANQSKVLLRDFQLNEERYQKEKIAKEKKDLIIKRNEERKTFISYIIFSSLIILGLLVLYLLARNRKISNEKVKEVREEKGFGSEKDLEIIKDYVLNHNNNTSLTKKEEQMILALLKYPVKTNAELARYLDLKSFESIKSRILKLSDYLDDGVKKTDNSKQKDENTRQENKKVLIEKLHGIILNHYNRKD